MHSSGTVGTGAGLLLERERELARIEDALASACAGAGVAVAIEGEAGIGKTALIAVARAGARERGMRVLGARGTELEVENPFGAVREFLDPVVRAGPDDDLFAGAAELAAPVVLDVPPPGSAVSGGVLHGLYWLVANVADRGALLLAVDDAHWLDQPSLRFLAHLARRIDSLPVALIVATRPAAEAAGALAELTAERLEPAALHETAVSEYLHALGAGDVDESFSRACHHATGGNPFLLRELVRTLREDGVPFTASGAARVGEAAPPQVARATRARLARLDPQAGALARAVAVLGDEAPLDLACELSAVELAAGGRLADALLQAGLLEPGRLLRFRHPLLRSAVEASVTPFERDRWHRKAASLLRARGAAVERIAVHLFSTTPGDPNAAETLRVAARRALDRGAPAAAAPLLRRALEEPLEPDERPRVLLELGHAERLADQHADAVEHLREAARLATDAVTRCDAILAISITLGPEPEDSRVFVPLVEDALARSSSLDRERVLRLQTALLSARWQAGSHDHPQVKEIAQEFAALPGDTPGECVALAQLVEYRHHAAAATELASLAQRAAKHARELLETGAHVSWAHAVVMALRWTDRLDPADRLIFEWIEIARRQGSAEAFAAAHDHRSHLNGTRGRLREAEADATVAVASAPPGVASVLTSLGLISALLKRGDLESADAVFRDIGAEQLRRTHLGPFTGVLLARLNLNAAHGRHTECLADYEEACRRTDGLHTGPTLEDWLVAIESRDALGDREHALREVDKALALARWWGTDSAVGGVLRLRRRLTCNVHDLHAAVEHLDRSPRRFELARALIDLGGVLRRAGHRTDSREPLRAGYELARECGGDGLAETARQELAASGVRLRRERLTGVESLTPSERRIADMAAEGQSNAEIAQALFVTIKTVEMHLTHAYQKLDIGGRNELTRALSASQATHAPS